jgi:aspartate kinase
MKVMKFGGASLIDADSLRRIRDIILNQEEPKAVVLSALQGVTQELNRGLKDALRSDKRIDAVISSLTQRHCGLVREVVSSPRVLASTMETINRRLRTLERLYYGISYIEELTPRVRDLILSFGERLIVHIMAGLFLSDGLEARAWEADELGIVTDREFGNASADLKESTKNVRKALIKDIEKGVIPFITGFFGRTRDGHTTLFGWGGSDYTAAVLAFALDASVLEVWKDVDGFMSANPKFVPGAHLVDKLSYREAAELAYFGAKILHPRIVIPVEPKNIPIVIKNTMGTGKLQTHIVKEGYTREDVIKSVTYSTDIALLQIKGAGVGYKPGVLANLVNSVSHLGVNIRSVITAQTCINLLLEKSDLDICYDAVSKVESSVVDALEKIDDVAVVGVVGEGLAKTKGLAARVFTAIAAAGVNVEMISSGASPVAFYLIVKEKDLEKTVKAVHKEFFA